MNAIMRSSPTMSKFSLTVEFTFISKNIWRFFTCFWLKTASLVWMLPIYRVITSVCVIYKRNGQTLYPIILLQHFYCVQFQKQSEYVCIYFLLVCLIIPTVKSVMTIEWQFGVCLECDRKWFWLLMYITNIKLRVYSVYSGLLHLQYHSL